MINCPLCKSADWRQLFEDKRRAYLCCDVCSLVFVPPQFHLTELEEKSQYDFHQNDIYDEAYRRFLSRLFIPLLAELKTGDKGLDFGCGPGPALVQMFREHGFQVSAYDKFYAADSSVLEVHYNFICCTEVLEHLREPAEIFELFMRLLVDDGKLGIMTKLFRHDDSFASWHYKNDPTHIIFFSRDTFNYLAKRYQLDVQFVADDAVILAKKHRAAD